MLTLKSRDVDLPTCTCFQELMMEFNDCSERVFFF